MAEHAFPVKWKDRDGYDVVMPGMTLRDYFAAAALFRCADKKVLPSSTAKWCYELADAMLAARQETTE